MNTYTNTITFFFIFSKIAFAKWPFHYLFLDSMAAAFDSGGGFDGGGGDGGGDGGGCGGCGGCGG